MKDIEIQNILLNKYYERRKEGWLRLNSKDFNDAIEYEEIIRISIQLNENGLIEWDGYQDETGETITGEGKISSSGIKQIEESTVKKVNPKDRKILEKLLTLLNDEDLEKQYEDSTFLVAWSSKVVPLLQFNPHLQSKFMGYQKAAITSDLKIHIRKAFDLMKTQMTLAIEELKLSIELNSENKEIEEKFFDKGFEYDACKALGEIISSANNKIYIVDNYIDKNIFDFFSTKKINVELYILTQKIDPGTKFAASKFAKQYGPLEIKTTRDYHDRFIIIDEEVYYHFGASLKDLGNKVFMFSKLMEAENQLNLLGKWKKDWAIAQAVVL